MTTQDRLADGERRSEERKNLLFATTVESNDGTSRPVLVRDISPRGLLLELDEGTILDRTVSITLPEAGTVSANVIWQGDKLAGCRLENELPQGTIDLVRESGEAAHAEDVSAEPQPMQSAARSLAARLKELRIERGLTRAELAERSGISTPSIWAWETGRTVPRIGSLEILAKGLGVDVASLQIGAGAEPAMGERFTGGERMTGDQRNPRLAELIRASKAQIAAIAGVSPSQISITITL